MRALSRLVGRSVWKKKANWSRERELYVRLSSFLLFFMAVVELSLLLLLLLFHQPLQKLASIHPILSSSYCCYSDSSVPGTRKRISSDCIFCVRSDCAQDPRTPVLCQDNSNKPTHTQTRKGRAKTLQCGGEREGGLCLAARIALGQRWMNRSVG